MSSSARGLLDGRTALILGVDDIGAGIARRFVREGARVAVANPAEPARADTLATELEVSARSTRSAASALTAISDLVVDRARALGGLDVLVCNLLPPSSARVLADLDERAWAAAISSVGSALQAMRAALPWLKTSGRGRIVLVGHRYGESVSESLGAYNTASWGLVGLARTAAVEWGQYHVATNVLIPLAQTAEFDAARAQRPAIVNRLVDQLPLRRVGDPVEDVGGAAALLASDTMGWMNGEIIHADGGQHVAGPVLNPARYAT